jgi:hypothetical protein
MSKKQLLILALVASIPAAGLLLKMLLSLLHLLSDQSSASVVLWLVYVVCLLGSAFIAFLPLLLWLYYPAEGFAAAGAGNSLQNSATGIDQMASGSGEDDDVYEDDDSADEDDDAADEGEAIFDEDALDEDFDELEGGFDIEDDKK